MSSHRVSRAAPRSARAPDPRVRDALSRVPRASFASSDVEQQAGPVDDPSVVSTASVLPPEALIAAMLDALSLVGTERVLEVGSGTPYQAALLSQLAQEVYALVPEAALAHSYERSLKPLGCPNVHVVQGQGHAGWPAAAP